MIASAFALGKMPTAMGDPVSYSLITANGAMDLSLFIGQEFQLQATGRLTCIVCGREVRKFYGQGMCFPCLQSAPEASECIVRPELCRAHLGEGRDPDWEIAHHATEHIVYLSRTSSVSPKASGIKVGVTRGTQVPTRWIDQGAVAALPIARVPFRQLAGLIEVELKASMSDRTDWRAMLCAVDSAEQELLNLRERIPRVLPAQLHPYLLPAEEPTLIHYPVLHYPAKVKSVQLAKQPLVKGRLVGIKGQYLIWEDGQVLNVRNHSGCHVEII